MPPSELSDAEILSLARSLGLNTDAPFGDEIIRSYRGVRAMSARIEQQWTWADEPAFRFDPEAQA
jgi:hypothetical protein